MVQCNTMKTVWKLIFTIILFVVPSAVFASTHLSTSELRFDKTISDQSSVKYVTPKKIYIAQVTTQTSELLKDPELWVQTLYYYSITRLNFADMPYNYLIDSNGVIYDGKSGGMGANPEMQNSEGVILIGYLSNDPILTNRASTSLYSFVDDQASLWGISSVSAVKLSMVQSEGQLTKLKSESIKGDFAQSVIDTFQGWKGYTKESLSYKAKITDVQYEKTVDVGGKLHVAVKVKNLNDFAWINDSNPIYVSVQENKDSAFAINGVWDSFSKATHSQNTVVKPGEEITFEFDMQAQVKPGEVTEKFEILKFNKSPFADSQFEVKFTIVKGDKSLVQVASSQYGFVNIRECQWYSCKIIDTVDNGAVFILLKEENGWMKIQYNEDTIGWVFSKYMKKI